MDDLRGCGRAWAVPREESGEGDGRILAATFVYPLCVDKAVEIGKPDSTRNPGFRPEKEYVLESIMVHSREMPARMYQKFTVGVNLVSPPWNHIDLQHRIRPLPRTHPSARAPAVRDCSPARSRLAL